MVKGFKSVDFYGGLSEKRYSGMTYNLDDDFFKIYDDLVACEYVPEEISEKINRDKKHRHNMGDVYTKIVYKGDLYNLSIIEDFYNLCMRIVQDFFPEGRDKDLFIKAFEMMKG